MAPTAKKSNPLKARVSTHQKIRMIELRQSGLTYPKIIEELKKESKQEQVNNYCEVHQIQNPDDIPEDVRNRFVGRKFDRKTVKFWVNEWQINGRFERVIGKRRPKSLSNVQKRRLVRFVKKYDTLRLRTIKKKCGLSCSLQTISRYLVKNNLSMTSLF